MLDDLAHSVSSATDVESLVRPLLKLIERVTGLESTYLTEINLTNNTQKVTFSQNKKDLMIPEKLTVPWDDTLCKRALEDQVFYTDQVPNLWPESSAATKLGLKTYVSQPIHTLDGSLYGTICAVSSSSVPLAPGTLEILSLLASIIAHQIDREQTVSELRTTNAQLLTQSTQDPLTGVANRRALRTELEAMLRQSHRTGDAVGIAFIDLDDFKIINDRYGHDIGDRFLVEIASRLSAVLRSGDLIARYGGDEFVIAVPDADPQRLGQRLVKATSGLFSLEQCTFIYRGPSIGLTMTTSGELDPDAVLARADEAMYEIKRARKSQHKQAVL